MRIFYDTEFVDDGTRIHLISIGMVRDDGREIYAINAEMDTAAVHDSAWLMKHVWPSLPKKPHKNCRCIREHLDLDHPAYRPYAQIGRMVSDFIQDTPHPELWAWYAAYDHVALAQLFGPMTRLPTHIPMWTNDLKQEAARLGNPPVPEMERGTAHNALADARHNRVIAHYLDALGAAA